MQQKFVTANNRRYSYFTAGSGDALIYLCGFGTPCILSDLYPLADLQQHFQIVALERQGYGDSGCVSETQREGLFAALNAVIEAEHLTHITLLAHSLGTLWALEYAKQNPLERIVLLDSYPVNRLMCSVNARMGRMIASARRKGKLSKMPDEKLLRIANFGYALPDALRSRALKCIRENIYNDCVMAEIGLFAGIDRTIFSGMENIQAKVVCICRKAAYKKNLEYARHLSACEVIRVEKSSHYIHHDCAQLVKQVLLRK